MSPALDTTRRAAILNLVLLPLLGASLLLANERAVAAERAFALRPFSALELDLPAHVVLREGGAAGMLVSGPKEAIDRIEVVEREEGVRIFIRGAAPAAEMLSVQLGTVGLESLTIKGSGRVQAHGLAGPDFSLKQLGAASVDLGAAEFDKLQVELGGSGDIDLAGSAGRFDLLLSGAGDVRACELAAQKVKVRLTGVGKVEVAAGKSLDVEISGAGSVRYEGSPALSAHLGAFGIVERK